MATGGEGRFGSPGGLGGSVELIDAVGGAAAALLTLEQIAFGGAGSGAGGDATSILNLTNELGGDIDARLEATGGSSGSLSFGAGGDALAGLSLTTSGDIDATVLVTGGKAGAPLAESGLPVMGYDGADATFLPSRFESTGDGTVFLGLTTIAGEGGSVRAALGSDAIGSIAGDGASVAMVDVVEVVTAGTAVLFQTARGGGGGDGDDGAQGGSGGSATSAMTEVLNAGIVDVRIVATGGQAGDTEAPDLAALDVQSGGSATAIAHIENQTGSLSVAADSQGGWGGRTSTHVLGLGLGGLAADGGDATSSAFGQTEADGVSLHVTSEATGGYGSIIDFSGEFRGGAVGEASSEAEGVALGQDTAIVVEASALGGGGAGITWSSGNRSGDARDGGSASAIVRATNHGDGAVTATATGGMGGNAGGDGDGTLVGGNGGEAVAFAVAESLGGGPTIVNVTQIGGEGGEGLSSADAGDGAHSVLDNAFSVIASSTLEINQTAIGGGGGVFRHRVVDRSPIAGDGGDASSSIDFDHTADLEVEVIAQGGDSGYAQIVLGDEMGFHALGGDGGSANTTLDVSTTGSLSATSAARGGAANSSEGLSAGAGGAATSSINAAATGDAPGDQHFVSGTAQGGRAGSVLNSSMAILSDGGDATSTVFAQAEKGDLAIESLADGGTGGYWSFASGLAGSAGGSAVSNAAGTHYGTEALTVVSSAIGGNAGELSGAENLGFVGGNADSIATAHGAGGGTVTAIADASGGVRSPDDEYGTASAFASSRSTAGNWSFAGASALSNSSATAATEAVSDGDVDGLVSRVSVSSTTNSTNTISSAASIGNTRTSPFPSFASNFELIADGLPTRATLDDLLIEEVGEVGGFMIVNPETYDVFGAGADSTALGIVSFSTLQPDEFVQGAAEFTLNAGQLDPDEALFLSLINPMSEIGDLEFLDLVLKIDDITHFSESFHDFESAANFLDDNPIELGLVGSLFDGGLASLVLEVSTSANGDPVEISFDAIIGTSTPEPIAVPIPLAHIALGGFLMILASSRAHFARRQRRATEVIACDWQFSCGHCTKGTYPPRARSPIRLFGQIFDSRICP